MHVCGYERRLNEMNLFSGCECVWCGNSASINGLIVVTVYKEFREKEKKTQGPRLCSKWMVIFVLFRWMRMTAPRDEWFRIYIQREREREWKRLVRKIDDRLSSPISRLKDSRKSLFRKEWASIFVCHSIRGHCSTYLPNTRALSFHKRISISVVFHNVNRIQQQCLCVEKRTKLFTFSKQFFLFFFFIFKMLAVEMKNS